MKTNPFKEILRRKITHNCTDDYEDEFLFYESAVIEAYNECVSQTQPSWIPVEVRNPIVSGRYYLTVKVDDSIFTVKALFNPYKNKWISIGEPLAWQPITIPEPYNPQTDK